MPRRFWVSSVTSTEGKSDLEMVRDQTRSGKFGIFDTFANEEAEPGIPT
jgi:hypothetical protein